MPVEIRNVIRICDAVHNSAALGQNVETHKGMIEFFAYGQPCKSEEFGSFFVSETKPFLLMEKAEFDLERFSRTNHIDVRDFIDWMVNVCSGLLFLHVTVELVHLDVKPANLHDILTHSET